ASTTRLISPPGATTSCCASRATSQRWRVRAPCSVGWGETASHGSWCARAERSTPGRSAGRWGCRSPTSCARTGRCPGLCCTAPAPAGGGSTAPRTPSESRCAVVDELADLLPDVRRRVGIAPDVALAEHVRAVLHSRGAVLGGVALERAVRAASAELFGAGPLQALLDDPETTDVLVNGPRDVWVERGGGLVRADVDLGTDAQVRELAVRLAAAGGQRLDDASPMVDARLPDGTRLHAVVPPVCERGALISLRVLRTGTL